MRTLIPCLATTFLALTPACNGDADDNGSAMPTTIGVGTMTTAGGDVTTGGGGSSDDTTGNGTGGSGMDTMGPADTTAGDGMDMTGPGTDTANPPGPVCQHQCATPQDCFLGGEESAFGCNAGVCSIACASDMECVTISSGWDLVPCTNDGECDPGLCVDTGGGVGGCSLIPAQGPCSDNNLVEMMATSIAGGMVTVCGQPDAICLGVAGVNQCVLSCVANGCPGDLTCGADGACTCQFDTQCVDTGNGNNCNADGLCEFACQAATDCPLAPWDGGTLACL